MKRMALVCIVSGALLLGASAQTPEPTTVQEAASSIWAGLKQTASHATAIAKIKAIFADRKDIPGGYIRVREDSEGIELAGFVPDRKTAEAAEEAARKAVPDVPLKAYWTIDPKPTEVVTYETHVGEQAQDALVEARVRLSLAAPAVTPQFTNATLVEVDVRHGNTDIYIVADEPPGTFDLSPHVTPIEGVRDVQVHVVCAYGDTAASGQSGDSRERP